MLQFAFSDSATARDLAHAADLLDRARAVIAPHVPHIAGLRYYQGTIETDACGLRSIARNTHEGCAIERRRRWGAA